jgi:hypothetical protein
MTTSRMTFAALAAALIGVACSRTDTGEREVRSKSLTQSGLPAAPPLPPDYIQNVRAHNGVYVRPSEAVVPKPVSEDDLRALPTNKLAKLSANPQALRAQIEAKLGAGASKSSAAAATAPVKALPPPDPDLLKRQQAYLDAWKAQKAQLDQLPADEQAAALGTLKASYLGDQP